MKRKIEFEIGEYYHVFNKSIARFRIFNNEQEYERMLYMIRYYQNQELPACYSHFIRMKHVECAGIEYGLSCIADGNTKLVEIIAFCLMPTHVHFILEQLVDNGISKFMGNIQNSYARYFNKKIKRLGPLWVGRFKEVLIETDEQMLHLSRYIHLNPSTAELVKKPEAWRYSSYQEYLNQVDECVRISYIDKVIDMSPKSYRQFMNDQVKYQKELQSIRNLILE